MIKNSILVFAFFLLSCAAKEQKSLLAVKTELPKELKEISGITAQGSDIWAITDKPHANVYKLNQSGKLVEKVTIANEVATDVEAVASDSSYIYVGDVGDNNGDRVERRIIKIAKAKIASGSEANVAGEAIEFTFPNEEQVEKKKQNNFDCESLISFKDSLYVFTKDREDKETRLYALPKTSGKYEARLINSFNSKGLITDAAISKTNDELALIGYHKGHRYPFIILFNHFKGADFFSGEHTTINLASQPWDWQLEGITYGDNDIVYFSCEGTKQVKATFYGIKREDLPKLNKKKENVAGMEDDNFPGLSKKRALENVMFFEKTHKNIDS